VSDDTEARLKDLNRALNTMHHEAVRDEKPSQNTRDLSGAAQGLRLSAEFIAGIFAGTFLGWGLDHLASTSPFGLLGGVLLGFAAGIVNLLRASGALKPPTLRKK
jgi:ATP synthase protein I